MLRLVNITKYIFNVGNGGSSQKPHKFNIKRPKMPLTFVLRTQYKICPLVISNLLTMRACSSTMLHSPMIIGPASAMIEALGWITVMLPIVISPRSSHSLHTIAPGAIFTLKDIIASASK